MIQPHDNLDPFERELLNMDLTDDDLYQQCAAALGVPMGSKYEGAYTYLTSSPLPLYEPIPSRRSPYHDDDGRQFGAMTVGARLYQDGGLALMKAVAYRVLHRVGAHLYRDLNACWQGVGDWGQDPLIDHAPVA